MNKPTKKLPPKAASTITSEELRKDIESLVTDMKSMLDTDLVEQKTPA